MFTTYLCFQERVQTLKFHITYSLFTSVIHSLCKNKRLYRLLQDYSSVSFKRTTKHIKFQKVCTVQFPSSMQTAFFKTRLNESLDFRTQCFTLN